MIRISGQDKKQESMFDFKWPKLESLNEKETAATTNKGAWFNDGTTKIQNENLECWKRISEERLFQSLNLFPVIFPLVFM